MQVRSSEFTVTDEMVLAAFERYDPRVERLIEARGRKSLVHQRKRESQEPAAPVIINGEVALEEVSDV
jgi:hypothetical protein